MTSLLLMLALTGCDDTVFNSGGGGEVTSTGFDGVVEIFNGECVSCHGATSPLGDLDLATDPCASIVGVAAANADYGGALLVDAGNASGSVLYDKMANLGAYGGVMPLGGALSADLVALVGDWIDAGASCESGGGDGGSEGDGGSDGDGGSAGDGGAVDATFQMVQETVFTESCTSCHYEGSSYGGDPVLTAPDAWENIVGVVSATYPTETFVVAGDSATSFLFKKMAGKHGSDQGAQMPIGSTPSPEQLELLSTWIDEGAVQ
jgi:hypothetical protein